MSARYILFPFFIWILPIGGGAGEAGEIRDGGMQEESGMGSICLAGHTVFVTTR